MAMSIAWYRSPVDSEDLKSLSQKSELKAHLHVLGHISLIICSGLIVHYLIREQLWLFLPFAVFCYGTFFSFLGLAGATHELYHRTVFKSKFFNKFYYYLFALLTWNNPVLFKRSHKHHHVYTLHPDQDGEVDPNSKISLTTWFFSLTFNLPAFYRHIKAHTLNSLGLIRGSWAQQLFPEQDIKGRAEMTSWSRTLLLFHLLSALIFLALGMWELVLLINLGAFFGNFFPTLLAHAQHYGKELNSDDYRKNSRTVIVHPLLEFLYWGMNYHIEHHMYPQVPFYNLARLHEIIRADIPDSIDGIGPLVRNLYLKRS